VRAPERPVVPNVTATSPTEIKMSWCRVKPNKIEIDHYELFIDNELEYSGIDVMYVAKRLKPWTWYEVKLRACGFQPGFSCSPFSRPILVKTLSNNENNTAIHSTASVFKVVVLPTYMFIAGVLVGVVILAMALIWRIALMEYILQEEAAHKTFSYISIDNASKEKDLDNNIAQLPEHDEISHEINVSLHESHDPSKGVVIVVDNSNIYIGAQECASANNASDRKRHVRVKLQNLVKILENNRLKERTFVCGSSPPATEHVWDVYRHLGYVVDLEERRGKDEQRVDEGLHLFIYKAICELSPRVLVLASGDGMKGKSENSTSFPGCATMALDKGWSVEVYSWKHSLSAEWLKLAKKYPDHLTINYLDKYVNHITFVDGKHGRKCLPVTGSQGRERPASNESRSGRLIYHNG
ncbi:hypothetical protein QZH41_017335, partial [Actinostola sp. cb2023]